MSEGDALQFDRAEFENNAGPSQCAECQNPLIGHYYDVNGQTVCEGCRYAIEARTSQGSGAGRFVKAAGAGFVAAILGSLLYYGIRAVSGYEFGLIAIVVGFAVGAAVRWGSNGRGGWLYQGLAMMLTYFAIVATYVPLVIDAIRAQDNEQTTAITASATPGTAPANPTPASTATPAEPAEAAEAQHITEGGPVVMIVGILLLLGFAAALPFLMGIQNIIGLIIIGIGLYEAWKLNRRTTLTVTGPHALGKPAVQTAGV